MPIPEPYLTYFSGSPVKEPSQKAASHKVVSKITHSSNNEEHKCYECQQEQTPTA
jgi:hypothetical protein